ncbi:hypothetical protein [Limosilactobacillus ingluviei]|uniref:hypothetical protein n=1 Tax=Limosilactobacillus ingluviei TaxID=148604 RepID=UPI0024B9CAEF|nr:hypothetical protein [Limosilactobacillus ingluviei]
MENLTTGQLTIKQFFTFKHYTPTFIAVNYHRYQMFLRISSEFHKDTQGDERDLKLKLICKIADSAIESLPATHRIIAKKRYLEGCKVKEILPLINYSKAMYTIKEKETRVMLADAINDLNREFKGPLPLIVPF